MFIDIVIISLLFLQRMSDNGKDQSIVYFPEFDSGKKIIFADATDIDTCLALPSLTR